MADVVIRSAAPSDALAAAQFCQPIYAAVYPNAKYGLTPEHFSAEIFETADTITYFEKILATNDHQRAYIAESGAQIVGTISIERLEDCYEIHAFYVAMSRQRQGIGKRLMAEALAYVRRDLPVHVEVAETNAAAIDLYVHWGFRRAPHLGVNLRHWPEWPEGLHNAYVYLEARKEQLHV